MVQEVLKMSKYTTNFYSLLNMGIYTRSDLKAWFMDYELSEFLTQEEIKVIETRGTWSKERLADKIIDEYYLKDFGFETPYMFKHYAKVLMKEIMESKLPLIYSNSIKYNILDNVDYKETLERTTIGESSSSGLGVNSDTPQGQVNKSAILNGAYASSTGANESESNAKGYEEYTKHIKGNSGVLTTNQKLIAQYRENIRAIDYEIIRELKQLFIGLL